MKPQAAEHNRGSVLLDALLRRLYREKIVRPGLTRLEWLVEAVRTAVGDEIAKITNSQLTAEQKEQSSNLLVVPPGETLSPLQRLKETPARASGNELLIVLEKVEAIRELNLSDIDLMRLFRMRRRVDEFEHICALFSAPINTRAIRENWDDVLRLMATIYGDMAGTLCPIADVTKPEVIALARWIDSVYGVIPRFTLERPPSAELEPDQIDPFDYPKVAPAMERLVQENRSDQALRRSEHKRWQMGVILKVSEKSFGAGRMIPITRR